MSQSGLARLPSSGGGPFMLTITGNDGLKETPDVAGNFNFLTANATVKFAGSANTETLDFGLSNLILGSLPPLGGSQSNTGLGFDVFLNLNGGLRNTAVGVGASQNQVGGFDNVSIGYQALMSSSGNASVAIGSQALMAATGSFNVAVGQAALAAITNNGLSVAIGYEALINVTAGENTAVGYQTLINLTTGTQNTAFGQSTGSNLVSGSSNCFFGRGAGQGYTTSESSNICIMNLGTALDANTIRIGTQGSGAGQQNRCFLAGVLNTVSGRVVKITTPGAYPYTTLTTDYVILVDTSLARTINLISSPVTGTTYRIKDNTGSAGANNITITPAAGNIDGAGTKTISNNFGSVDVVYNGTQWNVL